MAGGGITLPMSSRLPPRVNVPPKLTPACVTGDVIGAAGACGTGFCGRGVGMVLATTYTGQRLENCILRCCTKSVRSLVSYVTTQTEILTEIKFANICMPKKPVYSKPIL